MSTKPMWHFIVCGWLLVFLVDTIKHKADSALRCGALYSSYRSKKCFLPLSANYSTYLFRQRLYSRLTALWCYTNFVLLLLLSLLLLLFCVE